MPSWEELTMFDRALHLFQRNASPLYPKKTIQQTVAIMRQARRFQVPNRAAERIRDAIASYPELIFENSEFAIPPFPIMWVEFDSRVMLHHDVLSPFMSGGTEDWCGGSLANRGFVTVFA